MRRICALFSVLAALLFLLAGCGPKETVMPAPSPSEVVTPTPTATPTSTPTPTPPPTPEPTEEPKELWGFPIDDTHDAFEVPTGGKLGTVLVTVERGEDIGDGLYRCAFSVWDSADLTTPIQTFEEDSMICWHDEIDANFDGYTDFCYTYYHGAANATFGLYLWDEEQGQFVLTEEFFGTGLWADEETKTLQVYVHLSAVAAVEEHYRWEDGELVCFREGYPDEDWENYVTYELIDGEMVEVSREPMRDWQEENAGEEGRNAD